MPACTSAQVAESFVHERSQSHHRPPAEFPKARALACLSGAVDSVSGLCALEDRDARKGGRNYEARDGLWVVHGGL